MCSVLDRIARWGCVHLQTVVAVTLCSTTVHRAWPASGCRKLSAHALVVGACVRAGSLGSSARWAPRGVLVAHLAEHRRAVTRVAVARNGAFFVTASADETCKVWDCRRLEKDVAFRSKLTYASQARCATLLQALGFQGSAAEVLVGLMIIAWFEYMGSSTAPSARARRLCAVPPNWVRLCVTRMYVVPFQTGVWRLHVALAGLQHPSRGMLISLRILSPQAQGALWDVAMTEHSMLVRVLSLAVQMNKPSSKQEAKHDLIVWDVCATGRQDPGGGGVRGGAERGVRLRGGLRARVARRAHLALGGRARPLHRHHRCAAGTHP